MPLIITMKNMYPMNKTDNNYFTIKETADCLHVSTLTVRNWIKTNKIKADFYTNNQPFFLCKKIYSLKEDLLSGKNTALKSRRNKEYSIGNNACLNYLSSNSQNKAIAKELLTKLNSIPVNENNIKHILYFTAQKLYFNTNSNSQPDKTFTLLLKDLCSNFSPTDELSNLFSEPLWNEITYNKEEDFPGFIYSSLRALNSKKKTGAYFTPPYLAKELNNILFTRIISNANLDKFDKKVLDPACGSASFLLTLPEFISFDNIYGNDIDSISIFLTRINFYLKDNTLTYEQLCEHFSSSDFLTSKQVLKFDYIIGNPPWGSRLNESYLKKLKPQLTTASKKSINSFDLFIEKSINSITDDGNLGFIVPKSLINVKAHEDTRHLLTTNGYFNYFNNLEDAFDNVICPGFFFSWAKTPVQNIIVHNSIERYEFEADKRIFNKNLLPAFISNSDYSKLSKLLSAKNVTYLKDNAVFGLGIVTGNNKASLIENTANFKDNLNSNNYSTNTFDNLYPILKGTNIHRYKIDAPDYLLEYRRETLQQAAPLSLYQSPKKLVYRFINKRLTFALDTSKTLTLNSANFVIPQIDNLSDKYILAVLNSSISQFIFEKYFCSVKVLRSHLEALPIPLADEKKQQEIIHYVDLISCCTSNSEFDYYDKIIDKLIEDIILF